MFVCAGCAGLDDTLRKRSPRACGRLFLNYQSSVYAPRRLVGRRRSGIEVSSLAQNPMLSACCQTILWYTGAISRVRPSLCWRRIIVWSIGAFVAILRLWFLSQAASVISHLLTDSNGAVTRKQNPISKPSGIVDRLWASWSLESSFNCLRRCGNNLEYFLGKNKNHNANYGHIPSTSTRSGPNCHIFFQGKMKILMLVWTI